ncbi:MAG: hypothetical protein KA159_07720, partial [Halioglobus sp.]|nr:hypothetical protein [Halioglobus sp.]
MAGFCTLMARRTPLPIQPSHDINSGLTSNRNRHRLDIIQNIPDGEEISLYRNGEFTDLCAGPHVMRTGNIGAFKLT